MGLNILTTYFHYQNARENLECNCKTFYDRVKVLDEVSLVMVEITKHFSLEEEKKCRLNSALDKNMELLKSFDTNRLGMAVEDEAEKFSELFEMISESMKIIIDILGIENKKEVYLAINK